MKPESRSNIAILHSGRCGSVVLSNALNQHPLIAMDGEILAPGTLKRLSEQYATQDPMEILGARLNHRRNLDTQSRFYGCETQLNQISSIGFGVNEYIGRLERLGFNYIIVLKRKNHLRRIVSSIIAHARSLWHQGPEAIPQLTRISLDVDSVQYRGVTKALIQHLLDEMDHYRRLAGISSDHEALQLSYEDDISEDPREGYQRICDYLKIDPVEVSIRYGKTNPFILSDVIANFDEVVNALRGSPFEWMVSE